MNKHRYFLASAALLTSQIVYAQSGTWTNTAGGSWPTAGNWAASVASGADNTADFSTLDITANATVTLDGARTIGNLVFGDTTPNFNWILNTGTGGPLTLDVTTGSPLITVNNQTATIGAVFAGNDGIAKAGSGILILNTAATYTGTTTISAGTLSLNVTNAISSSSPINLGNATLQLNTTTENLGAITVNSGITTATIAMPQNSGTISHTINGATLNSPLTIFQSNNTGTNWNQISWSSKITGIGGGSGNDTLVFNNTGGLQNYFTTNSGVVHDFVGNVHLKGTNAIAVQAGAPAANAIVPDASMIIIDNGATWRWNGGTFTETVDGLAGAGAMTTNAASATLTINASNLSNDGNRNFSGVIGSGNTIIKSGAGTQVFSGLNSYTGNTTINGGTLLANTTASGTNSATGTGAVSVNANAKLGGTGQIRPGGTNGITVALNGVIAPGSSIGTLTIDSGGSTIASIVTMAPGSQFEFELGTAGGAIGTFGTSDRLVLANSAVGDVTFNSNVINFLSTGSVGFYKLFDTNLANATNAGDSWAGLTYDETSGVVSSGLTALNLNGTGTFIVGTASNGGDQGDIYLSVAAIPEPSTLVAGSVMVLGLALAARRRRR